MHERNHRELQAETERLEEGLAEVEDRPAARWRERPARVGSSRRARLAIVACLALWAAPAALAEPPPERDWTFAIKPYIWLPAMTGDVTIGGVKVPVETSISDLFTGSDFLFGLMMEAEVWYKRRWGLLFDGQWTVLEQNDNVVTLLEPRPPFFPGLSLQFDLKMNMGLFEFAAAYDFGQRPFGSRSGGPTWQIQPLVGARVTVMNSEIDLDGGGSNDVGKTWADPILGARGRIRFGNENRWSWSMRSDFGGFGAGSDFTWNALGAFGYEWRFETWQLEALLGARALYQDFEDGSGLKRFEWDVTQYGPFVALAFKF
jgi:hypothetical protein